MATKRQIEFIQDLLSALDWDRGRLIELGSDASWEDYEKLPPDEASELIDALLDECRMRKVFDDDPD